MSPAHRHSQAWFTVRKELAPRRRWLLGVLAFLLPLALWSLLSYTNIWKPMVQVTEPGSVDYFQPDMQIERKVFQKEYDTAVAEKRALPAGFRVNPAYFPSPLQVARAFYTAFHTPPLRTGEPWLHESLLHSIRVIFWGFFWSALFGIPLGVLCGTFALFARLFEPPIDFVRYMPAPAFGALTVALFGLDDAPKVAIIFIGTFFQMVLVVANTTRLIDPALLEAAQTLGASRVRLVKNVIIPGILPNLYSDMRILLGWAWTYLIVAELIGTMSGISAFIYMQAKYRNFDNAYAAIIMIGIIGLATDQVLAWFGRMLFPWHTQPRGLQRWLIGQWRTLRTRRKPLTAPRLPVALHPYPQIDIPEVPVDPETDPA